MLIKCHRIISPATKEDLGEKSPWLQKNKEYVVLALNISNKFGIQACIQTEHHNEPACFDLDGFEVVSQHLPSNWITQVKEVDDQTIIEMLPKNWAYQGFFEELENENLDSIAIFNKEAELIYNEEKNIK